MSMHPTFFRDLHNGEMVWILANGPSLLNWRIEDFRELGGTVFGVNKSWLGRKANEHGPAHPGITEVDYHGFVSGNNVEELLAGFVNVKLCTFLPADYRWAMMRSDSRYRERWCVIQRRASSTPGPFRDDVGSGFDANFSGYFVLQIAVYMGFKTFCLVGYDCNDREGHHWDENPYLSLGTRGQMIPWMRTFYEWTESQRGAIAVVNCSPNSAIPFFPKVSKAEVSDWLKENRRKRA